MSNEKKNTPLSVDLNKLVAFPNTFKKQGDTSPNFKGVINVDGKEYALAIWSGTTKKGGEYLSGRVEDLEASKKYQKSNQSDGHQSQSSNSSSIPTPMDMGGDDDLPF